MVKIVGACGSKGSGKDNAIAKYLKKHGYVQLSFASIVKDIVAIIFDWDRKLLEGDTVESRVWREKPDQWWSEKLGISNFTPRYALQYFGTDLFRKHFHPNIWIFHLERKLTKYEKVVVTDCRFPNEIGFLRQYNAKIIHIYRGKLPEWFNDVKNGIRDPPSDIHESETAWIRTDFDLEIENNGTFEDVEIKLKEFLGEDL